MPRTDPVAELCRAICQRDGARLRKLIATADPDGKDRWGQRPLLLAASFGDRATVERLLDRGATVDQGRTHLTPLTLAARRGADDIVALLRAAGAQPSLVTDVYLGAEARVARALAKDDRLARLEDEQGAPIIHHAAFALRPPLIELLLAHGADVNQPDRDGQTALHVVADRRMAAREPAHATVTLLLARGAHVDARNWADVTPLHQAVRARNLAAVELLLEHGADPNARDNRGSTPLRRAVSATGASATAGTAALMVPLTELLLAHGADPHSIDRRGVPVWASARAPDVRAVLAPHVRTLSERAIKKPDVTRKKKAPPRRG